MAWTSPRTWVSGELVTASIMNTYIRDNQNLLKTPINDSGELEFTDASELTIASGVITVIQNYHKVDTQGDAASDDLDTITAGTNVAAGFILHLRVESDARTVVLKNGTTPADNLDLGADVTLDETYKTYSLVYDGTNWRSLSYAAAPTFASLSPLTTRGDILYGSSGTVTGARLAVGAANTLLGSDGTDTAWQLKPLTTRGDILYGSSGTPTGTRLAAGAANTLLGSDGTDVAWQLKPLTTRGDILYGSSGVPTGTRLAVGGASTYLKSDGTDVAWSALSGVGKVLQVVTATYDTQTTSTSATPAASGLTVDITPATTDSKVLIIGSVNGCRKDGSTGLGLLLTKDGSAFLTFEALGGYDGGAGTNMVGGVGFAYLHSPSSTSACTYAVTFKNTLAAGTVYVQGSAAVSQIAVLEIS